MDLLVPKSNGHTYTLIENCPVGSEDELLTYLNLEADEVYVRFHDFGKLAQWVKAGGWSHVAEFCTKVGVLPEHVLGKLFTIVHGRWYDVDATWEHRVDERVNAPNYLSIMEE